MPHICVVPNAPTSVSELTPPGSPTTYRHNPYATPTVSPATQSPAHFPNSGASPTNSCKHPYCRADSFSREMSVCCQTPSNANTPDAIHRRQLRRESAPSSALPRPMELFGSPTVQMGSPMNRSFYQTPTSKGGARIGFPVETPRTAPYTPYTLAFAAIDDTLNTSQAFGPTRPPTSETQMPFTAPQFPDAIHLHGCGQPQVVVPNTRRDGESGEKLLTVANHTTVPEEEVRARVQHAVETHPSAFVAINDPKLPIRPEVVNVDFDQRRIQWVKQISYGKNRPEYRAYTAAVPKDQRSQDDPQTPRLDLLRSKRSFTHEVSEWRRALHAWRELDLFSVTAAMGSSTGDSVAGLINESDINGRDCHTRSSHAGNETRGDVNTSILVEVDECSDIELLVD